VTLKFNKSVQPLKNDIQFQTLKRTINYRWPDIRKDCPKTVLEFWNHSEELSVENDIIILKKSKDCNSQR
jgi:hypothetical protein